MKVYKTLLLSFLFIYAWLANSPLETSEVPFTSKEVWVETNDAKIFCRLIGKGDPIVVIHGGPALSQEYLLPAMAKLGEEHLVIFYDQRGCGRSTGEVNPNTINLDMFVSDLDAIRKTLKFEKISVLGHSWGGFLAMEYTIEHPKSVDKLILLNSGPASADEYSLFLAEYLRRIAPYSDELNAIQKTEAFREGDPETIACYYRTIFRTFVYTSAKVNLLNFCMTPKAAKKGMEVAAIFQQNLFTTKFNLHPLLKNLDIPTLIIHGDFDPIPVIAAENIHKSISNSKYVVIEHCGHFPYVEEPEILFSQLNQFFKQP